jgi:hypothetical protein
MGLGGDVSDAVSRRFTRGQTQRLGSTAAPDKRMQNLIQQGKELTTGLLSQDAGLSPDFIEKWDKIGAAYKAGAVSIEELTAAQAVLLKQQPFMKSAAAYEGDMSDAVSRRIEQMTRGAERLADLNAEIFRLSGQSEDDRKQALTGQLESLLDANPSMFTPEQLEKIVLGIGGVNKELTQTKDIAGDFASVFESGFEKAIISGEKLSDVLKALGMDLLQIGLRTAITQPLGQAAGNWFSSIFSNFLPSFAVGTDYVPHDMVAKIHKGERIVPAAQTKGGMGGMTVINNFTVGDVASVSRVKQAIRQSESRMAGGLARSRQYGGAMA